MSRATLKAIQAAAGNAGEAVYVDDVFSTYLYEGNGSTQTITNGIDLSGEGGLVWIKNRDNGARHHGLFDTVRGATKALYSNQTWSEGTESTGLTVFNSNGFSLGSSADFNGNNESHVGWTFRKQPGFFDVVTYTGNSQSVSGVNQTISHNLGTEPGMIIVKRTDGSRDWMVYHRSLGATKYLNLNNTGAETTTDHAWVQTPTSTEFYVGQDYGVNGTNHEYVAYLFAHDAQDFGTDSDESIIKCGSYTGNGSTTGPVINLGWEPQWLLVKSTTTASDSWILMDTMRGIVTGQDGPYLWPNSSSQEYTANVNFDVTPTGFAINTTHESHNGSGQNYIYVAIRRPHKPASELAATDLFAIDTRSASNPGFTSGFPVDFQIYKSTSGSDGYLTNRLTGNKSLLANSTAAEGTLVSGGNGDFDYNTGWMDSTANISTIYSWMFRRAPGFFDVVAYTGDGVSGRQIPHNLGAVPQLMITKIRSAVGLWRIGFTPDQIWTNWGSSPGAWQANGNIYGNGTQWIDPTESVVTVHSGAAINQSGSNYIQYLFGTLPGISKVGKYTGTGSAQDIDCGFSGGARFVMITNYTNPDYFYVWDSERGIITGSADPRLAINSSSAQATTNDALNAYSGGFGVTSNVIANSSGDTYIFLAIA